MLRVAARSAMVLAMSDVISLTCSNHPPEKAVGRCESCGKPFCEGCRVEDVAGDRSYCSRGCLVAVRASVQQPGVRSDADLIDGLHSPIRTGWRLWARSAGAVSLYTLPVAIVLAWALEVNPRDPVSASTFEMGDALFWITAAFGVALVQVVLTQKYSGHAPGNPLLWTIKRFLPWCAAVALAWGLIIAGYLALFVPGIYLSLRLFWAEEFTLAHGASPLGALRESWALTRDSAGAVFGFQFLAGLAAYGVILVMGLAAALVASAAGFVSNIYTEPLQTTFVFWALLIGYAGLHAPEIVYLYGMRAERANTFASSSRTLDI